jgi:hypothetical protein
MSNTRQSVCWITDVIRTADAPRTNAWHVPQTPLLISLGEVFRVLASRLAQAMH